MKKLIIVAITATTVLASCTDKKATSDNPFFAKWDTPFGVPPFDKIKNEHYLPAFEEGVRLQTLEIDSVVNCTEAPTFENTIVAYDNSGKFLEKVALVFYNLNEADMSAEKEPIQEKVSALMTSHSSDIMLNAKLFERIKAVYQKRADLGLDPQQARLLEKIYKSFERNGANLSDGDKTKLREINTNLSRLMLAFGNNLRKENSSFAVIVDNEADLKGLSQGSISAAADEAKARGAEGKWAFTLDKPSMLPFLQYAENRELRKQLYTGYLQRANNDNENDNKTILDTIVNLRLERANLLGYPTHAAYVVEKNMAKQPEAVYALLNELWTPALKRAAVEKDQMKQIMNKEGISGDIQLWDWWFYAEKLRTAKYDMNEEEVRPYFELNNVRDGIFALTTKLYGITYKDITKEMPLYFSDDNQVFEVLDKDGSHLGVMYFDFHPRASKSVGAWCTTFRGQSYENDKKITPVVSIVCNFTKPSGDMPALLSIDEVETFFHEYGHGLHALFTDVKYRGLAEVERDLVELPSQIMENWAFEPEVLRTYAKHYKTGEIIPDALITKIENSGLFNQGFRTVEYVEASLLDMEYHTVKVPAKIDANKFESDFYKKYAAMPEIAPRYRSTYFKHIFASEEYSAGYYVYIWAEVLDADAFNAFKETGNIFDQKTADAFRRELLSRGGSADGNTMYRNFRGKDASKEHLLKNRGLI